MLSKPFNELHATLTPLTLSILTGGHSSISNIVASLLLGNLIAPK